jgi:DNA-binding winged helix-turn-helix (wHTH) protein/Tol biopolymer transport system component
MNKIRINGRIILDSQSDEILVDKKLVKLTPKHFKVLLYLIERNGELVTRDELFENIWHDTIVVDESLTRAISEIRKIIEENPKEPKIIQTIPKKGYRLSAIVDEYKKENLPIVSNYKAMGMTIISLCLLVLIYFLKENNSSLSISDTILPITSYDGIESQASINNDSKEVLFYSRNSTKLKKGLYLKKLKTEELILIDTTDAKSPLFLGDKDNLIYIKNNNRIIQSSKWGKNKKELIGYQSSEINDLDYSDNKIVYVLESLEKFSIRILDLNSFNDREIYQSNLQILSPIFIDNSKFVYTLEFNSNNYYLLQIDLISKEIQRIILNINQISDMVRYQDRLLLSASNRIYTCDLNGLNMKRLTFLPSNISKISVSDNGRILINQEDKVLNIWQYDLENKTAKKRIASVLNDYEPFMARNESSLYYLSNRCGNQNFWKSVNEKEEDRPITKFINGQIIDYCISDDGNFIFFIRESESLRNVYQVNTVTLSIKQLTSSLSYKANIFLKDSFINFTTVEGQTTELYQIDTDNKVKEIRRFDRLIDKIINVMGEYYIIFQNEDNILYSMSAFNNEVRKIANYGNDIYSLYTNRKSLFISFSYNNYTQEIFKVAEDSLNLFIKVNSTNRFVIDHSEFNLYISKSEDLLNSDIYITAINDN